MEIYLYFLPLFLFDDLDIDLNKSDVTLSIDTIEDPEETDPNRWHPLSHPTLSILPFFAILNISGNRASPPKWKKILF